MKIEVSIGEIVDKLSILTIKKNNIRDEEKLANVTKEYEYLYDVVFNQLKIEKSDYLEMVLVNEHLWWIEESIRKSEKKNFFGEEFIQLARSVYRTNDERAAIKKAINIKYGSNFVEEKSY